MIRTDFEKQSLSRLILWSRVYTKALQETETEIDRLSIN
jgi:hypothetical protein